MSAHSQFIDANTVSALLGLHDSLHVVIVAALLVYLSVVLVAFVRAVGGDCCCVLADGSVKLCTIRGFVCFPRVMCTFVVNLIENLIIVVMRFVERDQN